MAVVGHLVSIFVPHLSRTANCVSHTLMTPMAGKMMIIDIHKSHDPIIEHGMEMNSEHTKYPFKIRPPVAKKASSTLQLVPFNSVTKHYFSLPRLPLFNLSKREREGKIGGFFEELVQQRFMN
jgi:hypothetical protein